jgi:L-aspartate oxidase
MDLYTDVVIVGTGAAGLYAALNIKDNVDILMISKGKINECNTNLAQGGICCLRGEEDIESFIEDTMKAGKYENDKKSVEILVKESIENIENIYKLGMNLDKDDKGNIRYTKEGAHSINRIVHYKDKTGEELEETLIKNAREKKNITIYENTYMVDLIKYNNVCSGVVAFKDQKQINIHSRFVILACGGIGGVFKNSTNERILTGDGIATAIKNNIEVANLDYIQFHPTSLYENQKEERRFLISEAVRGEGGKILNKYGNRFVEELLPRDIVTKYIYEEEKRTNSNCVYLDVTFMEKFFLKNRFPTIYNKCKERGIDISKEFIPITPAQHYFMGGIKVDNYSRTSMENLFACGEVSCTGVHGKNRLASNSLLEALVFSKRAAKVINDNVDSTEVLSVEVDKLNKDIKFYRENSIEIVTKKIKELRRDIENELAFN